ncbi:MAG: hypothetical protein ABUL60_12375, partial [Myxococcales bacterium]
GPATFEGFIRIHQEETDVKIVMVATARHEDVALGTPAAERLRQLRDVMDGTVIEVQPLQPETTKEMLRASLPLDDAAVEEAARRSRGNPLFALQQLHAWALGGNMEFLNGTYRVPPEVLATRPQTTAELWDSRVNSVPEQYRAGPSRPPRWAAKFGATCCASWWRPSGCRQSPRSWPCKTPRC